MSLTEDGKESLDYEINVSGAFQEEEKEEEGGVSFGNHSQTPPIAIRGRATYM